MDFASTHKSSLMELERTDIDILSPDLIEAPKERIVSTNYDFVETEEDPMDVELEEQDNDSALQLSCLSLLEGKLDTYSMDIVLSYLTLVEYSRLSIASKILRNRISKSTHLHMKEYGLFQKRRIVPINSSAKQPQREDFEMYMTPQKELQQLMHRFDNVSVLNLQGLAPVGDDLIDILNNCPSALTLKSITLHSCALSYWCAHSFRIRHLESLTLTGNSIRSRMTFLLQHSTNLKSLTFKQCPALRDGDIAGISSILNASLEELVLNHTKLSKPVASFPILSRASFAGSFCLTSLSRFHCPNLKSLNLSFCVRLSGSQIERMLKNFPLLETLILVKCAGVDVLNLDSKSLQQLDIGFTHNLGDLSLACPSLWHLDTTCCSSLQSVSLENCYKLRALDLSGSLQLRDLRLKEAKSLTDLKLRGCRLLNYCYMDCPQLQHADVTGCRGGAIRHCQAVQDAAMDCRQQ